MESKTIHRLLGFKPPNGYEHDSENPIKGDVLIIDECSMIDIVLTEQPAEGRAERNENYICG